MYLYFVLVVGLVRQMILNTMPAVALLVAGPSMPDRSKVMTIVKKQYSGPPGWVLGHEANNLMLVNKIPHC